MTILSVNMSSPINFLPVLGLREVQPARNIEDEVVLELEIPSGGLAEDTHKGDNRINGWRPIPMISGYRS